MSPIRIEEDKKEEEGEIFKAIKESHQPLLLDSGATAHVHFERKGPTKHRSQGNNEIVITEFNQEFDQLFSSRAFQQVHPAN